MSALPLVALLLTCLGPAARAKEQPCALTSADSAAVVKTMQTMYAGATHDDFAVLHSVTTPDFYAFDGGEAYAGDALFEGVRAFHQKGYVFVWTVTDPHVEGTCHIAWIRYRNRGSIDDGKTRTDVTWLESAVLRNEKGTWKIAFFHSTRAK